MKRSIALAMCIAFAAGAVLAQQQYRWVDDKGRIQYTDTPPPPSAKDVKKLDVPTPPKVSEAVPFELKKALEDFPVTLYTHPECKEACQLSRDLLNKRGVPFKETQVYTKDAVEELKKVSGSDEVPVLTVGSTVQRGFAADAFEALLTSAGYPRTGILPPRTEAAPEKPKDYVPAGQTAPQPTATPAAPAPPPEPLGPYAPGASGKPAPKPAAKSK